MRSQGTRAANKNYKSAIQTASSPPCPAHLQRRVVLGHDRVLVSEGGDLTLEGAHLLAVAGRLARQG